MAGGFAWASVLGDMMKQDYASTSPMGLWRDDYDRRAREGEAKYYAQNKYPWAVQSAKDAGLHPLFALGASGGGTLGGSNTAIRSGGGTPNPTQPRNKQLIDAQIRKENANANYLDELAEASKAARGRQGQPYGTGTGATVYPMGSHPSQNQLVGGPIRTRPRVDQPNQSRPLKMEVINDDGARFRVIDSETGDEISQGDILWEMSKFYGFKSLKAVPRESLLQWKRGISAIKRSYREGRASTRKRRER